MTADGFADWCKPNSRSAAAIPALDPAVEVLLMIASSDDSTIDGGAGAARQHCGRPRGFFPPSTFGYITEE
jgi:hypothetical protein